MGAAQKLIGGDLNRILINILHSQNLQLNLIAHMYVGWCRRVHHRKDVILIHDDMLLLVNAIVVFRFIIKVARLLFRLGIRRALR